MIKQVYALKALIIVSNIFLIFHNGYCANHQFLQKYMNLTNFTQTDTTNYLMKYGYLKRPNHNEIVSYSQAIRDFQKFANIPVTGVIDISTIEMMKLPRCGLQDVSKKAGNYKLSNSKWNKNKLTYAIKVFSDDLTKEEQRKIVSRALQLWANVSPLEFKEKLIGHVDIPISFLSGDHGDGSSFDGKGNVLAHAFYPPDGKTHLDADEDWSKSPNAIDMFTVIVHEFGHAIGLDHSEDENAVMAPFYRGPNTNQFLSDDDIRGIQAIYGKPVSTTPSPTTTEISTPIAVTTETTFVPSSLSTPTTHKTPTTINLLPTNSTSVLSTILFSSTAPTTTMEPLPNIPTFQCPFPYSAVMKDISGEYLAFIKDTFYRINQRGVVVSPPKYIRETFKNAPDYVSAAAFDEETNTSYIFCGHKVSIYRNKVLQLPNPRYIHTYAIGAIISQKKLYVFSLYAVSVFHKDTMQILSVDQPRFFEYALVPFYFSDAIITKQKDWVFLFWDGHAVYKRDGTSYVRRLC